LRTIEINPQFNRLAYLQEFNPQASTYVVSDLHTKLDIQKILFNRYDFLAEDAVLRASELWQRLLLRSRPDLQIVSQSLLQSIVGEWLEMKNVPWASGAGASQNLLVAIQQFLPVYLAPEGPELFKDWLAKNPNALLRMGQWFFLGYEAWNYLLDKKIIITSWVPAILAQLPALPQWPRNLVFDLEANLTGTEGDLIKRLDENVQVEVFMPVAEWRQRYFKVLWPYEVLIGNSFQKPENSAPINVVAAEVRRWTTRMTEGKSVVAQVRAWLEAGVPIHEIAVLAPDIEEYWPLIASYFEIEGIPVNKSKVAPLHSFVEVSAWLARLRIAAKNLDSADLEIALYNSHQRFEMAFENFRSLFKRVYDFDDLKRDEELFQLFNSKLNENSRFTRDAFISWAIQCWQLGDDPGNLQLVIAHLLNETPPGIELAVRAWVRYLEAIAAKTEKTVEPASDGLAFMKIESGFYQKWTHVCLIGLTESAVKGRESSMLTLSDIVQIGQDLGFYLDYPDKPRIECIADWIAANTDRTAILSFAATNFNGEPDAPSLFWLSRALASGVDIEKYSSAMPTRWDELQSSELNFAESLRQAVNEDLGRLARRDLQIDAIPALSASQVERFIACPFKFTADKMLKLVDASEVDLDLDHRTRGSIQHALFEILLAEPLRLNYSENELAEIAENLRQKEKLVLGDPRLWPAYKARLINMAQKFLDFEKDWRQKYPHTRTIGREFAFDLGFKITTGEFCPKDEGDFNFRGRIDRVDESTSPATKGHLVLIDYKSSGGSLTNHGAWLKNSHLQLAFYSMIMESGLTTLGPRTVGGAFYYITKDFTRNKGMQVEGASADILPIAGRGNNISSAAKEDLYAEVRAQLKTVAATIKEGRLHVKPKDQKDCPDCRWRKLCRAPHLN
jgi:ATP-dependent helicase/nuclease subunit B